MKRLHRLTSLLVKLQSSKTLNIKKVSDDYEVSERTVYRDIKALEEAGVPIGYEPNEGYFLLDGYRLPPIHMTTDEAYSMVTAQAIIDQNSDISLVTAFAKAVEKVKAVMKTDDKEKSIRLEAKIKPSIDRKEISSSNLMLLQEAIIDFKVLKIDYQNARGILSKREIEPFSIYFTQNKWIVIAYCKLRKEIREFRTDRIKNLNITSSFFPPHQFSLDSYFKNIIEY